MAFEEAIHSMYDPRLKPLLLNTILAAHLPDDRQPRSPSQLSVAVSAIRRHHLLYETHTPPAGSARPSGSKCSDPSSEVVDEWIKRLLILISSSAPEKCWAGVCLLGVTCQECTRQRFLESYSSWFHKLLVHLKPTDFLFVQGAACASLTDLITRLGSLVELTGVRREGTMLSGKLFQPLLQILDEEGSDTIWSNAADLLCALLKYFPTSLKQHFPQVETLLVTKMMRANSDASVPQKFARCLALLPRAFCDAATWSSLIRRVLLAINSHLDDALAGMEDASIAKEAAAVLVPRGQEPPWPLGDLSSTENTLPEGENKLWQLLVPRISSLLQCCYFLLVNPYPVQVRVPLGEILALITRIISVDGSPYKATSSFGVTVSIVQQVSLCSELPVLHSYALDLLYATLCGVRSQLLPRAADIVRLLTEYFRHCGSPGLRIMLYGISKHLLISLGVGMATALTPAIIDNALSDLKSTKGPCSPYDVQNSHCNASIWGAGWSQGTNSRKRKDTGSLHAGFNAVAGTLDVGIELSEVTSPVALQIAALQAVEALVTVGGALQSDHWRTEVDLAVANIAINASVGTTSPSIAYGEDLPSLEGRSNFSLGDFQLAAYKAFLASLLSPRAHRPPYLSQGLILFRKGRQEAGTEVAEFCAHALLSLEPLIHPRCLPLANARVSMVTSMATERGTDSLVSQIQRCGVQLTGATSLAAVSTSLGYAASLVSPLKVNHSGMHLEVDGDSYVQEDIESWIIDYGGDQSMLNETNATSIGTNTMAMAVESFNEGIQAVDGGQNATPNAFLDTADVSARQSAATDEEGFMTCMVGDYPSDAKIETQNVILGTSPMMSVQMSKDNLMIGSSHSVETPSKEANGLHTCVPMYAQTPVPKSFAEGSNLQEESAEGMFSVSTEDVQLAKMTCRDGAGDSGGNMDVDVIRMEQDSVPAVVLSTLPEVSGYTFSESRICPGPESDSDVIPDIVDGDPDTE